jgi:hypothetical protein
MIRLIVIFCSLFISACSIEATDDEMIANLKENRDIFQKMVRPNSDCNISQEPGPICRKLMKQANIFSVRSEPFLSGAVALDYNNFETENKGYLYSPSGNVEPLYENLDQKPQDLGHYQKGYKKISNEWYIFYEYLN